MASAPGKNQLVSVAGEHHVASELSRREWKVALTYRNMQRTDLLAEHSKSGRGISVQVKTKGGRSWRIGEVAPEPSREGVEEWWVFVDLSPGLAAKSESYVLPRDHVSALVHVQLGLPKGKTSFVNVADIGEYRDAWPLLEQPSVDVPWRLPEWVWEWVAETGLPNGHRGLGDRAASV